MQASSPGSRPSSRSSSPGSSGGSGWESDWEAEVTGRGEVFYVAAVEEREPGPVSTSQSRPGKKKEKKGSKLSRLVRRRESKRERGGGGGGGGVEESSDGDSSSTYSTAGQIKTFESFFEGTQPVELSDVWLRLVAGRRGGENQAPGPAMLEDCLGIIPGQGATPAQDAPFTANRVLIAGLRTDGPAIKQADKLKLGDWLRSIGILH